MRGFRTEGEITHELALMRAADEVLGMAHRPSHRVNQHWHLTSRAVQLAKRKARNRRRNRISRVARRVGR